MLGWAPQNRARILVPRAACGRQFDKVGVYLVDPRGGKPVFVRATKLRAGGA